MKNFLRRIIAIIIRTLNRSGMEISLFIVLFGGLSLLVSKYNSLTFYDYPYDYPGFEVVYVSAYDENNNNLKSQLYQEVIAELIKNNIATEVLIDTTYDAVLMRQKNWSFYRFADWSVYIGNQALTNVKNKNSGSGCVSGQIYVYFRYESAY
jgi:hypothetical protein